MEEKEQVEQEMQEVSDHDLSDHELQDVTGGLSENEKTGLIAGGSVLGAGAIIFGGGTLWQHLENKHNERLYGKSGAPGIVRAVSKGRFK